MKKNYSLPTISRHIQKLKEQNIIGVSQAEVDWFRIGMRLHIVLFELEPKFKEENIQLLELFCDAHPYTVYRNLVFGAKNGMLTMFVLPDNPDALRYLMNAFDILKEQYHIIESYEIFPDAIPLEASKGKPEFWDIKKEEWRFDIKKAREVFDEMVVFSTRQDFLPSILHKLNMFDIIMLREMTRDTQRTQKEIIKDITVTYAHEYAEERRFLKKSQQTISRYVRALKDNKIIRRSTLQINSHKFGLFTQVMFVFKYETLPVSQLMKAVNTGVVPFPNSFYQSDDLIFFWVMLPQQYFGDLAQLFYEKFEDVRVMFLGNRPIRYYLWHRNFDPYLKEWKVYPEWMIDMPLKALEANNLFPVAEKLLQKKD